MMQFKRKLIGGRLQRIGVFAGTFDPVHAGHIAFAKQAAKAARLDVVYFLVERRPRKGKMPEHYAHRIAMLREALKYHKGLEILELPEASFNVNRTFTTLKAMFPYSELHFLVGSDVASSMSTWPNYTKIAEACSLVIGLRDHTTSQDIFDALAAWEVQPKSCIIVESESPHVSSTDIRHSLRRHIYHEGLLASVKKYSLAQWLYVAYPRDGSKARTR